MFYTYYRVDKKKMKEKKILHLVLKRKYWERIYNKTKLTEYRDLTPYWSKRLEGRHYDVIQFRNGYAKIAPTMIVEYKGMDIDDGRYAIQLGKILESKNVT